MPRKKFTPGRPAPTGSHSKAQFLAALLGDEIRPKNLIERRDARGRVDIDFDEDTPGQGQGQGERARVDVRTRT